MPRYKKVEWSEDLMGSDVTVITHKGVEQRGFEANKAYSGKLMEKPDWMVGCPVFECVTGKLGLDYECHLVEKIG